MIWTPALLQFAMILALISVPLIALYGIRANSVERRVKARRDALVEARNAVQSLANVAKAAADETVSAPRTGISRGRLRQQLSRAYHYGRAAEVIASIPADRL